MKLNEFGQKDGVKKMEFLGFMANVVANQKVVRAIYNHMIKMKVCDFT